MRIRRLFIALLCALPLSSCGENNPQDISNETVKTPVSIFIEDEMAEKYEVGQIFDDYLDNEGLNVKLCYDDDSKIKLNKSQYSFVIKDTQNVPISSNSSFSDAGQYNVTVTYLNLSPVAYTISVINNAPVSISVSSVSLNKNSLSLQKGESEVLSETVLPENATNKSVNWSSSNESVATVNNGVVTAIGKGSSQIKVLTIDGRKTATCSVTVTEPVVTVEVTNISVTPIEKTLNVGESTQLTAEIKPDNATDKKVAWTSSNTSVATVSNNGFVQSVAEGTTTITAKSSNNLTATCEITVNKEQQDYPVDGNNYKVSFKTNASDSTTALAISSVSNQISGGSSYVSSVTTCEKLFAGKNGLKFGSSRQGGKLGLNIIDSISALKCNKIEAQFDQYNNEACQMSILVNGKEVANFDVTDSDCSYVFNEEASINSINFKSTKRCYLKSFILICEEKTPIDVTAISLPDNQTISINNTKQLTVTYTPSNANQNKNITWSTSNSAIATVNNGLVKGISEGTATITAKTQNNLTATCEITVNKVNVTSIALSSSSEEISIGNKKTLTATVYPTDATDKSITWSSSNTNVASVTQTGEVTALAVGTSNITVTSNDSNKTATCAITVTEVTKDAWTILIYMCGADLESESGLATMDITEILSVSNQPDDVNIVIETGGAKSWNSKYGINKNYLERYHVANKKLVKDEQLAKANMGLSSTLQSFIEYGLNNYPAEKTGLIFWNHGGAMYGVCYDENFNDDSLSNQECKTAFANALNNTGTTGKLEFVGYDACLMAVQDVAEYNSQYFNYMISSEESEAGYGWDYDNWVDDLYAKKSTETILKSIVDSFITDNGGVNSTRSDQTLSYLNLNKMSAYKTAFDSFTDALTSKLSSTSASTFSRYIINNVKHFGDDDYTYFATFDVKDFMDAVSSSSSYNPGSSYISNLTTAFNDLVAYSSAQKGAGDAYGLALVFCSTSTDSSYIKKVYTSTNTNFSKWLTFNKSYGYLG